MDGSSVSGASDIRHSPIEVALLARRAEAPSKPRRNAVGLPDTGQ